MGLIITLLTLVCETILGIDLSRSHHYFFKLPNRTNIPIWLLVSTIPNLRCWNSATLLLRFSHGNAAYRASKSYKFKLYGVFHKRRCHIALLFIWRSICRSVWVRHLHWPRQRWYKLRAKLIILRYSKAVERVHSFRVRVCPLCE